MRLHHQPLDNRRHACMIKCLPACVAKCQLPTDLVMQGEERGINQDHSQARRWRGWSGRTVWEPAGRRHRESSLPPAHGGIVSCWISQTWNRNRQVKSAHFCLTSVPQHVYFCLTPHPSVYLLLSYAMSLSMFTSASRHVPQCVYFWLMPRPSVCLLLSYATSLDVFISVLCQVPQCAYFCLMPRPSMCLLLPYAMSHYHSTSWARGSDSMKLSW